MTHERLGAQLAAYAAGALEPRDRARVEAHGVTCEGCRHWLATYRLFAREIECERHVPSARLAALAVGVDVLDERDLGWIRPHLEACDLCRQELDLSRQALAAARKHSIHRRFAGNLERLPVSPRSAAIATALLVGAVFSGIWFSRLRPVEPNPSPASIRGQQVVRADKQLVLENLQVEKGAGLVVRAADAVVLGNGFVVKSGGTLAVELGPSKDLDQPSQP